MSGELPLDLVCVTYRAGEVEDLRTEEALRPCVSTPSYLHRPGRNRQDILAVAQAVKSFREKKVSRIILTRPAGSRREAWLSSGRPSEQGGPILRPLYDAMYHIMDPTLHNNVEKGAIEIAPCLYEGRTLDDSFIILDEAQNTTPEQMKMFRSGSGRIKGGDYRDVTQVDLFARR